MTNRRGVAMLILGSVLLLPSTGYARGHEHFGEEFSIDLNQPYDQVVKVVQKVANNEIIQGTFEYKGTHDLGGARSVKSSRAFEAWSGLGTVLYKERPNTLAPENFYATGDTGTVVVRYVIQPIGPNTTRLQIEALFDADIHHGSHPSNGQVESKEFEAISAEIELVPLAADRTTVRVKANVSAWYSDAESGQSGYVAFESNGRLESDLLDRLNEFLVKNKSKIAVDPDTVAKQIATVCQQRLEAERRISALEKQLQVSPTPNPQTTPADIVSVTKVPVLILSAPEEHASVLLRAQPEDEFEVLEHHGVWLRVGLEDKSSGWVKRAQVQPSLPGGTSSSPAPDRATAAMEGFAVIRETASPFSGDWTRLQGKQALYLWARPEGSIRDVAVGKKLKFVEILFKERYRELSHTSQNVVDGIVVIFLDQRGRVAAATLEDIAHWTDGHLSQAAFLKKCSLDPPGAFENAGGSPRASLP